MKNIFVLIILSICMFANGHDTVLKVAMREMPVNYIYNNTKLTKGFNYELAEGFANYLGLKLEIVKVNKFKDYWLKDGKIIFKMKPPVTPDIFKKADITLDVTSKNNLRSKYIDMLPYIKNKSTIFSHKEANIQNVHDLIGKKLLIRENMQSFVLTTKLLDKNSIDYVLYKCHYDEISGDLIFDQPFKPVNNKVNLVVIDKKSKIPYLYGYLLVYKKIVDASSTDSFSLFQKLSQYSYLRDELIPSFSLDKQMSYLSATVPKGSLKLQKKFLEFINKLQNNGDLDRLMTKHFRISLESYNKILDHNEN